ncbi:MAG: MFS transporter [Actinomycetota bacterium]
MSDRRVADPQAEAARSDELQALELGGSDRAVVDSDAASLGTAVRPRILVPTQREQALGRTVDGYSPEGAVVDRGGKVPLRARLATGLRSIDPRAIDGSLWPLLFLTFVATFDRLDDIAIGLLQPEIRNEFGFSVQFLVTIQSGVMILALVGGPAIGYLVDRVKRVWLVRIAGLFNAGGTLLLATASGVPQMILARSTSTAGYSVGLAAGIPLIADFYPVHNRARVFAIGGVVQVVAILIGTPVVGFLADSMGWRGTLLVVGAIALVIALGVFLFREPKRGAQERRSMGADEATAQKEQKPLSWGESWRAAGSIVTLRRQWYSMPFQQAYITLFLVFFPLYLAQEFALEPGPRGVLTAIPTAIAVIGLLIAGPVGDRLLATAPGRIMTHQGLLALVTAPATLAMVLVDNPYLVAIFAIPSFLFIHVMPAARWALTFMVVPARLWGLGLQTLAPWQLIGLVAAPFVGAVANANGIRAGLLVLMPIGLVIGAINLSTARHVERDIRAAQAAAMAGEELERTRSEGRSKMLICRDVDVTYGGTQVLFNVDFDVDEGEIVALLGTNGAGKSSLLKGIAGVHEVSNGAVFFDGEDITHVPPHENVGRGLLFVPGGRAVFPSLTVEENLQAAAWLYRGDDDTEPRIRRVLELFPILRERRYTPAGTMSGGEQQMLAIGQAFVMRPRALMIDELSLGLAPAVVEKLLEALREVNRAGTTIVLVEQSLNVAVSIAGRAVFMEKGEIRFDGPTSELVARPDLVRAVFMGRAAGAVRMSSRTTPTAEGEPVLKVRDLSLVYGGVAAVDGVTLDVYPREIVGIMGPNGAGKTSLFDAICGLAPVTHGNVILKGTDVTRIGFHKRADLGLGRSYQNTVLFPALTVRENITVALHKRAESRNPLLAGAWLPHARRSDARIKARVDGLVELLGLEAYADKFVSELSTGTRRSVDIACVLAFSPALLLLDEPSSGLAQPETEALGPVIRQLVKEAGCGVMLIEHDLPLLTSISDRLVAMELGKVIVSGAPGDVMRDPRVMESYVSGSKEALFRSDTGLAGALDHFETDQDR